MQRIGTQQECLTLLTLNIRLTTRVYHYLNTRLSNGKQKLSKKNKKKRIRGFCSRIYFKVDVLKTCPNCCKGYYLEKVTLKMRKYLLDALQFHEQSKFLAGMIFPR